MKRLIYLLIWLPLLGFSQEQEDIDPIAISLIDKMGAVLGSLEACSFDLETVHDQANQSGMLERNFNVHRIHMRGPDKFTVRSRGSKGNRGYWYNGSYITWYSFDENNYVTIPAPDNIIQAMDSLNTVYGMQFPAADLFYPSFADDLLAEFDRIDYIGIKTVDDVECFHIIAENDSYNFQLWIENGAYYTPKKYLILIKGAVPEIFEGTFNSWDMQSSLPDPIFEFAPPENADLISIMPKQ